METVETIRKYAGAVLFHSQTYESDPVDIYLLNVSNRNTRTMC